jgi:hypothetical protein
MVARLEEVRQGGPTRVGLLVLVLRILLQPEPAVGAQAEALLAAQRRQWQIYHHRIPQHR